MNMLTKLRKALQAADATYAKALAKVGVSPRVYAALKALQLRDMPQGELAPVIGSDRSTVSEMAKRMEADKLVAIVVSPDDRRARVLCLLPKGRELLRKCRASVKTAEAELDARFALTDAHEISLH